MNKAEFLDKHRAGNYLINDEFESDLDALLKEHAVEFAKHTWNPIGGISSANRIYDEWKQLTSK